MTSSALGKHITPWLAWWLSGMRDAWDRLPKPAALTPKPSIFLDPSGRPLSYANGQWTEAAPPHAAPRGRLLAENDVLLRRIHLPVLKAEELQQAIELEARSSSPFPWASTLHGHSIVHAPDGLLDIEIALTRQRTGLDGSLPLYAQGFTGPIPMGHAQTRPSSPWYRDGWTLILLGALALVSFIGVLTPTLLMRADVRAGNEVLARLSAATAPMQAQRDELVRLQQDLDQIQAYARSHPIPLVLLDDITRAMPDGSWLIKMELKHGHLILDGYADDSGVIVSALERIPGLKDVRLGSGVTRNPGNGKEIFRIEASLVEQGAQS
ncbi:MAG: PilN domain-containing protein [Pseudomonadota bacterium]|jgi:general secretion pathway protein L